MKSITSIFLAVAIFAFSNVLHAQLQSDQSDAVWSIVMPIAASVDVDMGKVLLGNSVDKVVGGFVANTGSYLFRVDSIFFKGADAGAFSLVSGIPRYNVIAGGSQYAEFRFRPTRVGNHSAQIIIYTQADTLVKNIIGEGTQPTLQVVSNLLDFGQVEIGNDRVITDTALIKNLSGTPINIIDVIQLGPDKTQFDILSGGGPFTIQPFSDHKLTLRFKPIYGGRTSGQLGFVHGGVGSPAIARLYGMGIGGLVFITDDSAYAGESRSLKLYMGKVKPEGIATIASNFEAQIRFQKNTLTPVGGSNWSIVNDSVYMKIKGTIDKSLELAQIPVVAGLGDVEQSSVDIVQMNLLDNSGNIVEYEFESQSGTFKLLGICYEGGKRLFSPSGKAEMLFINPNPASDGLKITVNAIEAGETNVIIYNILGNEVARLKVDSQTSGRKDLNVDLTDFSNGVYLIKYQTPTWFEYQKVMIRK